MAAIHLNLLMCKRRIISESYYQVVDSVSYRALGVGEVRTAAFEVRRPLT